MNTDSDRRPTDPPRPPEASDAPTRALGVDPEATEALDSAAGPAWPHPDSARSFGGPASGMEPVPGYRLERRIGRGGFGEVWRAVGPGGVSLALKIVPLDDGVDQGEARALDFMRTIRHPQLTGIAGAWQVDGRLIVAMELADSTLQGALDEAVEAGAPGIDPALLAEQMREAAKGIDYLNGLGIVHRDIKPQNLLLMGGGIKVADFGLARLVESSSERSRLSMTPSYAAPELCRGEAGHRTDQYALAVTYCKLRGGRLPFEGHHWEVVQKHLHAEPDLSMVPEVDRPALARALSKDPAERWPDCRSFVAALPSLRPAETPSPFVPEPVPAAVSRRSFLGAMAWAGSLAGAAVGSAAWTRHAASFSPSALAELQREEIASDVGFLRSQPPEPVRTTPPGSVEVDRIAPGPNDAFTILRDERVVDLRGWAEVPEGQPETLRSAVTMIRTVWVRKDREAPTMHFASRTGGQALFFRSLNQRRIRQVDQRRFAITGNQRQHEAEAIVDVADVPVGGDFEVKLAATHWNSIQTPEEQWFGVIGYGTARKVSQLLVFPTGRPFRSYRLSTARLDRHEPPRRFDRPAAVLAGRDRDWINWDIHSPEDGLVYRIEWTW